jgi:hypothetical protein
LSTPGSLFSDRSTRAEQFAQVMPPTPIPNSSVSGEYSSAWTASTTNEGESTGSS